MDFELIKEKIVLDRKIGEENIQIMTDGDIIVPDVKPDVSKILQCKGDVILENVNISEDKINFNCKIECEILYLADGIDGTLHSMTATLMTEEFINLEGITKDMRADLECELIHIDCKLLNGRKLYLKAVSEVKAKAEAVISNDIVTSINGVEEIQIQKSKLNISRVVENKKDKIIIKEEITVPSGKANVKEILFCNVNIADKECRISDGVVNIKGTLMISTLYKGELDETVIEFMEHEIPFNGQIDVAGCNDGMFGDAVLKLEKQYLQIHADEDGEQRVIELELEIGAKLLVMNTEEIEVVEDAYCINKKLVLNRENIKYPQLICKNKNQSSVKETVVLDEELEEIMQIYNVNGKAKIEDIKIIDDKIIAEGIINVDMLYIAKSDTAPLCSFEQIVPFRQVIEARGVRNDMNVDVDLSIEHISFNMLSTTETEVRFILDFGVWVRAETEVELIVEANIEEFDKEELEEAASANIYVVQPNDTLWKIAKKYNAGIDEIMEMNELEDDKINIGQKLLILKKILL